MISGRLILSVANRFLFTSVPALFVLALPFAFFMAGTEGETAWQVIGLYLAATITGFLEVLMYFSQRRQTVQGRVF